MLGVVTEPRQAETAGQLKEEEHEEHPEEREETEPLPAGYCSLSSPLDQPCLHSTP